MKSILQKIALLALALILTALPALSEGVLLQIEKSFETFSYGETFTGEYAYDRIIRHDNGFYEVQGRMISGGQETLVRWLYLADGTRIGRREYDGNNAVSDDLDIFYYLDRTFDAYVAMCRDVENVKGTTIYFSDGSYEEVTLKDDVVVKTVHYWTYGGRIETTLDENGFLLELCIYEGDAAEPCTRITNSFMTIDAEKLEEEIKFERFFEGMFDW